MKYYRFLFFILFIFFAGNIGAQNARLIGTLYNPDDQLSLVGATIKLSNVKDSTKIKYTNSDVQGKFEFDQMAKGQYLLDITYIGFENFRKRISINNKIEDLGKLFLTPTATKLKQVNVSSEAIRAEQKGDTTQYSSAAYKVTQDANTEDLVKKMPGITVENGTVKSQGEDIKKVLVDGKQFFGDDPTVVLKNLPAEVIDKIQVFDKLSDQSAWSGFDDGNAQKTMNIVTKSARNNGQFGKFTAGYGSDDRYQAGINLNLFKDNQRITIIGNSNNVNMQNFGSDDFLGAMGGVFSGGGQRGSFNRASMGGNAQSGITTTNSIGINYTNVWGTKLTLNGSYFYNLGKNNTNKILDRQYILTGSSNQDYNEFSNSRSNNDNHRLNFRLEYNINDRNSIVLTPRFSFQQNTTDYSLMANSSQADTILSSTANINNTKSNGYNFNNDLLYRYKFTKKGRTISVVISTGIINRNRDNYLSAQNLNYAADTIKHSESINQFSKALTDGVSLSSNLIYTEPLSEKSQLQFSYNISNSTNNNDKSTWDFKEGSYQYFDTLLSNIYKSDYITHNVGPGYLFKNEKLSINAAVAYQYSILNGNQDFPLPGNTHKTFDNILPSFMLNYKAGDLVNLRINYRASSNAPSVTQLQEVVDNSNPLLLTTGDPFLKQEIRHTLRSRLSLANKEKTSNFFAMVSFQLIRNYIGNSTSVAARDTSVFGQEMHRGAQLVIPANLDGAWNARTLLSYGFPIKPVKCNFNINAGLSYNRLPSLINNNRNLSGTYGINQGVVLSSNISQKLDFTMTYNLNYNLVDNSLQPELNNNYIFQISSAQFNWQFWKGLFVQTNVTYQNYNVISSKQITEYTLWNASFGSKLFKKNAGEIKLTAYDMLDQNKSLNRSVTDTYIENSDTQVLRQYFMLSFTYNLRNFTGKMPDMGEDRHREWGGGPPPHDH
jgi:hypothetical protein